MKKLLVGITGGIAAYKMLSFIRLATKAGFQVRVAMTAEAEKFITPLSIQALCGQAPLRHIDEDSNAMAHINWARWADLYLIAPATANSIAKLAQGLADNPVTNLALASEVPLWVAPAMNQAMWHKAVTQENLTKLQQRGITIIPPALGEQACGEVGEGRLPEPEDLFTQVHSFFHNQNLLKGRKILITAGATQEPLDPVRYISNHSSGKMGAAIAQAAYEAGAEVTLILGHHQLDTLPTVSIVPVSTAEQMLQAVEAHLANQDIFIATAAVADYRPEQIAQQKIKKQGDKITLTLVKNPDILANVGHKKPPKRPGLVIGFAAETDNLLTNARQKRCNKGADWILANDVAQGKAFGQTHNHLYLITPEGEEDLGEASKQTLAQQIIKRIAHALRM